MNGTKECGETFSHDPKMMIEGPMGNVYFRPMRFGKKGDKVAGHTHNFDHVTFLWNGSVRLRAWHVDSPKEIVDRNYSAPARVLIKKDWVHEFTALSDDAAADCVYAVRDFDDQVTDTWNGDSVPYR